MINQLVSSLLRPDLGDFAIKLYNGLRSETLQLNALSDLSSTLHRLSLCSYYEIPDDEFGDVSSNYRYWDPSDLCDNGWAFVLVCLKKMIADNIMSKDGALVTFNGCVLDMQIIKEKLISTAEEIRDEDEITDDWITQIDKFVFWTPDDDNEFHFKLLEKMDPSNANLVFDFCTRKNSTCTLEKLRENQAVFPENFYDIVDIREYHAKYIHSIFCYTFLERADSYEKDIVIKEQAVAKKTQSLRELLFALAKADVYLNYSMAFPYTVYRLVTEESYNISLKKRPTEQEILNDNHDIPSELKNVWAAAVAGDAAAQSELASRYLSGNMLSKDENRAVFWLKLASAGGDANAQTNYGVALQNGLGGVKRNYSEAIEWFKKAAEQGEPVAQYNLGLAYARGLGIERDLIEMNRWMNLSADGGYFMAKLVLENGLIINE